jgi:hypothetical protein
VGLYSEALIEEEQNGRGMMEPGKGWRATMRTVAVYDHIFFDARGSVGGGSTES